MDPLQILLVKDACRDLVLRAAASVDANEPGRLAALFAEGGVLVRPGGEPLAGREAIRQSYAQRPAERITRHLVVNIRVEVESETEARAESTVLVWSGSTGDTPGPHGRPAQARQVVGEFSDRLTLTSEGWRIARREARFVLHSGA